MGAFIKKVKVLRRVAFFGAFLFWPCFTLGCLSFEATAQQQSSLWDLYGRSKRGKDEDVFHVKRGTFPSVVESQSGHFGSRRYCT